nr:hypothetical protein CFP56_79494 [Quercus suber]
MTESLCAGKYTPARRFIVESHKAFDQDRHSWKLIHSRPCQVVKFCVRVTSTTRLRIRTLKSRLYVLSGRLCVDSHVLASFSAATPYLQGCASGHDSAKTFCDEALRLSEPQQPIKSAESVPSWYLVSYSRVMRAGGYRREGNADSSQCLHGWRRGEVKTGHKGTARTTVTPCMVYCCPVALRQTVCSCRSRLFTEVSDVAGVIICDWQIDCAREQSERKRAFYPSTSHTTSHTTNDKSAERSETVHCCDAAMQAFSRGGCRRCLFVKVTTPNHSTLAVGYTYGVCCARLDTALSTRSLLVFAVAVI